MNIYSETVYVTINLTYEHAKNVFIFLSFSSRSLMATQTKETSRTAKFVPPTVLQRPALGETETQKQPEATKVQTAQGTQVAKEKTSEVSLIFICFECFKL